MNRSFCLALITLLILPPSVASASFKTTHPPIRAQETREYYKTSNENSAKLLKSIEEMVKTQKDTQDNLKQLSETMVKTNELLLTLEETINNSSALQQKELIKLTKGIARLLSEQRRLNSKLGGSSSK